jgi:hypothetical protein
MTELTLDTAWQLNPDQVAVGMDGDIVTMNIQRGDYVGIYGVVGPRVWELLKNPVTLAELVATICAEYEVDAATCESDLRLFLKQLVELDLIAPA